MVVVPADMPVTVPVKDPIVATEVALLIQVPEPVMGSDSVMFPPIHTPEGPVMGNNGFTVIDFVLVHPVPNE